MNTVASTWYGWGIFIAAGGGAYYFAKQSVNADRAARHEEEMKKRRMYQNLDAEYSQRYSAPSSSSLPSSSPSSSSSSSKKPDTNINKIKHESPSPSIEASHDPVKALEERPPDQIPGIEEKYLAKRAYRSTKGDRFS